MVAVNSPYYSNNTRSRQSKCYQGNLKSHILVKRSFSNSIWLRVFNKYDKSASLQISTGPSIHFNDHVFCSQ